jgi:tetratricopeptide (TPR) repeat protein
VAGLIAASGCSASYSGERLFWQAQRQAAPILNTRSSTPTLTQVAEAIAACELVIKRVPQTMWAPRAHLLIAALHARQRQYAQAREAYAQVLQNYSRYQAYCVQARAQIASTYEAEGAWDEAANAYYDIADYHPWTAIGLQAPLYVASGYQRRKQDEPANDAYRRAVERYTKLLPEAPTKELTAKTKVLLAAALQRLDKWPEAAGLLEELIAAPDGIDRAGALMSLGLLYQTKLHDAANARHAYERLLKEFPGHPVSKTAKARLEGMGVDIPAEIAARVDAAPISTGGNLTIIPRPVASPKATSRMRDDPLAADATGRGIIPKSR